MPTTEAVLNAEAVNYPITIGEQIVKACLVSERLADESMPYIVGTLQAMLGLTLDDILSAIESLKQRDHKQALATLERRLKRFAPETH